MQLIPREVFGDVVVVPIVGVKVSDAACVADLVTIIIRMPIFIGRIILTLLSKETIPKMDRLSTSHTFPVYWDYGSPKAYSLLFGVPAPKLLYPEPQ